MRHTAQAKTANEDGPARALVAAGALIAVGAAAALAGPVKAQDQGSVDAAGFNTPYGMGYGEASRAFRAGTRDSAGNRVIVDGRILLGEHASTLPRTLAGDITPSFGFGTGPGAVGNQLNVIVDGDWNTVVIDSTQINTGDVTADAALNGELDLDD